VATYFTTLQTCTQTGCDVFLLRKCMTLHAVIYARSRFAIFRSRFFLSPATTTPAMGFNAKYAERRNMQIKD